MNIKIIKQQLNALKSSVFLITAIVFSGTVQAVNIAQQPLFLTRAATPNIMFILDDSGSMDWDVLTLPHFEASNYDRDHNRSWARGGWLNADDRNKPKISSGDWVSYGGQCNDRNADGICYNRHDLDGDGDTTDYEKAENLAEAAAPDWRLRLNHWYYWEYVNGYCWEPSAGISDATDYLPALGNIFAFLTGSSNAQAHTYNGTSWTGSNNPDDGSFTATDAAYDSERWWHRGVLYDVGDWANNPAQAAAKTTCLAVLGNEWRRTNTGRILHHGPDLHPDPGPSPRWTSAAWNGPASVINSTTGALTRGAGGTDGGYHGEYTKNVGTAAIAATGSLDINGDGLFTTPDYYERDTWGSRRVNYRYLDESIDNVYLNPNGPFGNNNSPWETCSQSDLDSSANSCGHLRWSDYPNNYAYDVNNSNVAATSPWLTGNENIITLPNTVKRAIKSSWSTSTPPSGTAIDFSGIPWAGGTSPAGTHHAMSKWDKWPFITDWRIRSASLNVLYYAPTTEYKPWPGLVNASFNAAKSNPQPGSTGFGATINLVRPHSATPLVTTAGVPYQHATEAGFVYEIWHDDAGFWSNSPQWNASTKCGIATASTGIDVNGWKASFFDGRYGATVRSVVLGTVDPATGHVVVVGDRVCSTYNNEPNGIVDLWDKHDRVTVYTDKIVVETVRRTPHIMGERYNSDPTKKVLVSDTRILNRVIYDAGTTYAVDGFCETVLGRDPANTANCRTVAQVQQNVANWYEFSRRRSFVAKGAIAQLIQALPDLNYGLMGTSRDDTVNNNRTNDVDLSVDISKLFKDVYDGSGSGNGDSDVITHNAALQTSMYNHVFRQSGTPLRQALQRAGEYFAGRGPVLGASNSVDDHSTSPITSECQKNFAIMLTDGYWSGLIPADVSGVDGSGVAIALSNADGDGYNRTLADVAKYYYDEDLSLTLNNEVPTDSFDTNDAQHLTTIGIGFGVTGNLVDGNGNGWPGSVAGSSLTESSDWGNPNINSRKIDDLWHAAYNSRGLYFSAKDPAELIQRLNEAVLFATATVGSASAVTANSRVLTINTRIYQTTFESGAWSGDVQSFGLTANGLVVQPAQWSAKAMLDSVTANSRRIITLGVDSSGNDEGIPFRWADLVDASSATATAPDQQQALRTRWSSGVVESVAFGQDQLNYLRGEADAQFRDRSGHKLGDIVHSEPLYVGPPAQAYSDSLESVAYSSFRSSHSGRDAMLYVGANDGMLHAFEAATGEEKFAYIPRVLIPSLNQLSHKNTPTRAFSHRYFVDDTPVSNDVFFAGAWRTVLVGGLRGGGKGIYALDVTTIPLDAEASAGSLNDVALWEFTDVNDIDMGYSFSKPSIVRLNNGNWAAIFGNGYDSTNGKAVLYIVEFDSDTAYGTVHKFDTGIGSPGTPNGLSTPTAIDTNGDMIADRVYAGDLLGNVWSFDISDNNDGNWALSYGAATPLFTATNDVAGLQPITAPISVEVHPSGAIAGYLLHFGTGKFFSTTDNDETGQQTQSIYALWDYGSAGITRADLWKHEIIAEETHAGTGAELRVTSDDSVPSTRNTNPFSWLGAGYQIGDAGWQSNVDRKGWRMDLINVQGGNTNNYGERIVSPIVFHGESVIYSTLLPGGDPCEGGGSGWLMTLNAATGARFAQTPFDINGDGTFSSSDFAAWGGGTGTAASGVKSAAGIPSVPLILNTTGGQAIVISDHSTGELPEDNNGTVIGGEDTGPNQASFEQGGGLVNGPTSVGRKSWIELD